MVTTRSIPLALPSVGDRERELVAEVLRSGSLAQGPMVPAFEREFAARVGVAHAIACNSGTSGLHAALHRVGVGPGDEVITSSFSFIASSNVIAIEKATPVFADIDERTLNIDPDAIRAAITPRTRAILPVHIFGYPAEMGEINQIAAEHGLAVVEDACEAVGAQVDGRHVGTDGNPAVFGFYPNKQLTTGEGGLITTSDDAIATELRSLINQGRSEHGDWLTHTRIGFNYRMDEMSGAVGLGQLERLDQMEAQRNRVAARYCELLAPLDGIELPWDGPHRRSWFVFYIRLAPEIDRASVIDQMAARGIATRPYLPAIHLQPPYREAYGYSEGMLPVTERVSVSTLALPFYVDIEDSDLEYVVDSLREVLAEA
jgi:perosamine synthetase